MKLKIKKRNIWLLIVSFACIALAFNVQGFSWLIFIALVPLFFTFPKNWNKKVKKDFIWSMGTYGFFYFLIIFIWGLRLDLEYWSDVRGVSLPLIIFIFWLTSSLVMSIISFMPLAIILSKLKFNFDRPQVFLVLPALWLLMEFTRSWLFSLYVWGEGASLGQYYNFGHFGFAAAGTPLVYAGRIVGLYGLTFLVVLINPAVYSLIKKRRKLPLAVLVVAILVSLVGFKYFVPEGGKTLEAATVQVGYEPTEYHKDLSRLVDAKLNGKKNDLLVLPEHSNFYNTNKIETEKILHQALKEDGVVVDTTEVWLKDRMQLNAMTYRRRDGSIIAQQNKNFLIPNSEYVPLIVTAPLRLLKQGSDVLNSFQDSIGVQKGSVRESPVEYNGYTFGGLACSAAIAPELYRAMVRQGAEVLINSAALNAFKDASMYKNQSRQMLRFLSVSTSRPFIQSSQGGYSFIIDSNGRIIKSIDVPKLDIVNAALTTATNTTPYVRYGEYFVWLSLGLVSLLAVARIRQAKSSRP